MKVKYHFFVEANGYKLDELNKEIEHVMKNSVLGYLEIEVDRMKIPTKRRKGYKIGEELHVTVMNMKSAKLE
jgi:hypothetical protein